MTEEKKKDKIIDEMAIIISMIMSDVTVVREQFEKEYCEFINSEEDCCWKINQKCSDCIKQYFEKKAESKNEK